MRPNSKVRSALWFVTAVVFATTLLLATPAFALLEDPPTLGSITSVTNPSDFTDRATWWRGGWGNSLFPEITFVTVPSDALPEGVVPTLGFLYRVDRDPDSRIDTGLPDPLSVSDVHWAQIDAPENVGSLFNHTYDLTGVFDQPPIGGWPQFAGARTPIEGRWYVHVVWANYLRYSTNELVLSAFYDHTDPTPVTTLDGGTSAWTETQRRRLTWSGATDALAGLGAYVVTVKNSAGTQTVLVTQPKPNPPGYLLGEPMEGVTLESLAAGVNKISVQAEDRATNLSTPVTFEAKVDTDTPTIAVQAPAGSGVGRSTTFLAKVADRAGISSVKFYIDGVLRYTDTAAPWGLTYNTASLGEGSHSFYMVATDMFGHTASTAPRSFTVHLTPPAITKVSAGPSPFFPRLRDGYLDDSTVKFRISASAKMTLSVTTKSGAIVRTITSSMAPGSRSLKWDGQTSKGKVVGVGTYYYRLTATDVYGNASSTSRFPTTVKYYIVVRVSASSAKLVAH